MDLPPDDHIFAPMTADSARIKYEWRNTSRRIIVSNLSMTRHNLILLVLLYAAAFRLVAMNRPFQYDDEATGCFYGVLARNYLRFGPAQTHGIPVLTVGHAPDASIAYYPDHPPLVPLLIAPIYLLFGVGEWQTRLPTSIATVAAVYVLYRLLRRHATQRVALIAATLFAAMPINLYFGGLPEVVGMPLVLFVLISVSAYLALHERPNARHCLRLIGTFTLAAVSDWPAFIMVPVFLTHFLTTRLRRQWPWILAFGAAACAVFTLLYIYIALATHAPWSWMVPLFKGRSALGIKAPFTARQWLATAMAFNRHLHTLPILVASGLWLATSGIHVHPQRGGTVARILVAWGILHVLIGRQGVFNHEWWWSPLTPGLAVTAALLIDSILTAAERRSFANAVNAVAMLLMVAFTAWTSVTSFRQLFPTRRPIAFTTMDLGEAIRAAAPQPSDLALLVWSGFDPQLWFYGDRPLRANVWSIDDFQHRLRDETADLMFGYVQPWNAKATGIVFPVIYRRELKDLHAYLQRQYPLAPVPTSLAEEFDIFDLRHPLTGTP